MTLLNLYNKKLLVVFLAMVLVSCSNPWGDRENNGDANLDVNLTEAIINTEQTSQFGELLVQTGYDKILAESKTYTVFVPTNEAMAEVDDAILNDPDALKQFVSNHIALTAYSSVRSDEETQIKMYSNKYLIFEGSTMIDDATIITADHYAKNGVFHIINKALTPKLNIWQYINAQAGNSEMADYLLSLKEFSIYESDSVAKTLSEEKGAGYLADSLTNSYLRNVYNLNNEKNSYTLFLMKDTGYGVEVDKMKPYLIKKTNDSEIDSTAIYASYFTLRDLAFAKKYEKADLPTKLISRFGVEVPIDKTKIVEEIHLSNGIVYVMEQVEVDLDKRLLTTQIEGEDNTGYANGTRNKIFYRNKYDPIKEMYYDDIMVQNPGVARFILYYGAKDFYSTTYKVYWRAINDRQTNVFQQYLRIGGDRGEDGTVTNVIKSLPYTNVEVNFFEEVYLGDFTLEQARDINLISLIAADNTTNGNNSLTLDYLKFIPQIKL